MSFKGGSTNYADKPSSRRRRTHIAPPHLSPPDRFGGCDVRIVAAVQVPANVPAALDSIAVWDGRWRQRRWSAVRRRERVGTPAAFFRARGKSPAVSENQRRVATAAAVWCMRAHTHGREERRQGAPIRVQGQVRDRRQAGAARGRPYIDRRKTEVYTIYTLYIFFLPRPNTH